MSRVKRGTISTKHRNKVLKLAKGFRFGRGNKEKQAKEALYHAGNHAFAHRRAKKRNFRRLWNVRISAGVAKFGLSYSRFIGLLSSKGIKLNRKVLSEIAVERPESFGRIVSSVTDNKTV